MNIFKKINNFMYQIIKFIEKVDVELYYMQCNTNQLKQLQYGITQNISK